MKSYTDLSQSKKLAEILSIESADMFWYWDAVTTEVNPRIMNYTQVPELQSMYYSPCWSLAALLDVLPANKLEKQFDGKWWFSVYLPSGQHKSHKHDNSIDACYEIIVRLHKLNLL